MRIALYTNVVSPHQLPLAREIVKRIGAENYRYIHTEPFPTERSGMGWQDEQESWIIDVGTTEALEWLDNADAVIFCLRDLDLTDRRCRRGLKTFYTSERWFKPIGIKVEKRGGGGHWTVRIPGWVRMLHPRYFRMVRRFVGMVKKYDCLQVLPIGVHAWRDFALMGIAEEKMTMWGYFVAQGVESDALIERALPESTILSPTLHSDASPLRVLWVGRMLELKHVETIIRAVAWVNQKIGVENRCRCRAELTIVGDGPEKERLMRLARKSGALIERAPQESNIHSTTTIPNYNSSPFTFHSSVHISEVRALMRTHDVYVLASDEFEGWGAVVSEALEEGMIVFGSNQAGSSATILPESQRFDWWDWERLGILLNEVRGQRSKVKGSWMRDIGTWSAAKAAERLLAL